MARHAVIDIGTNSVLLLVAERDSRGTFVPVVERAEITRLGRGVDATRALSAEGMDATLEVLERFASEARALGATAPVVTATSAARDARNGAELFHRARERAQVEVEVLSGEDEARLSFAAVQLDFGAEAVGRALVAVDVGGGSTEVILGRDGVMAYRRSLDVGSVRLTERHIHSDPPLPAEQAAVRSAVEAASAEIPAPVPDALVVGVAGTVTTLFAVVHDIEPYDASRVHGGWLPRGELAEIRRRLCAMPLARRRELPGLEPRRADVLPAGAILLEAVLDRLGAGGCRVSDRGLRWGVLVDRFGDTTR